MPTDCDIYNIELIDGSGRGFHNVFDFAKYHKVTPEDVIFALNNGSKVGFRQTNVFKYDDHRIFSENLGRLLDPGERLPKGRWEIQNLDTGVFYKDGADAARKLGCTRAMVSMCLGGRRKTCKGFRLKRVLKDGDIWRDL